MRLCTRPLRPQETDHRWRAFHSLRVERTPPRQGRYNKPGRGPELSEFVRGDVRESVEPYVCGLGEAIKIHANLAGEWVINPARKTVLLNECSRDYAGTGPHERCGSRAIVDL